MKQIKSISIGLLIAVIIFIGGVITGRYHYSTHDIKVVEVHHSETQWKTKIKYVNTQDNFDSLYKCYTSNILISGTVNNDILNVKAEDSCKSATAQFRIGTKGNWTYYVMFGIGGALISTTAILLLK